MLNNRYLIRSTLGRGGFGQTYLVEDTHSPSRRLRVVKQLKPQATDPDIFPLIRDRFEREAAILERLGEATDQIPTLHAYFSEEGEFYLVQDWIEGRSLAQKVREEGTFGEAGAREFLIGILPVLDFVHSQNVIHRDINPNNVMIRARDRRPVLIDFGAVKEVVTTVIDADGHPSSTIAIGSPGYMPLEQSAGMPVFASDIFSLGLTAVFSLTGKHPREMLDLRTGEISWRGHAPEVSESLASVLTKAIHYHAHNRFASAREMLDALQTDSGAGSPTRVFRPASEVGGSAVAEATTQVTKETVLQRDFGSEEQTLVTAGRPGAIEFIGNDEAYFRWLDDHPGGYVINTHRSINPNYMVLHKATCGMIKSTQGIPPGGYTERGYIKICSPAIEGLQSWVRQHGRPDGSFSSACKACHTAGRNYSPKSRPGEGPAGEDFAKVEEPLVKQSAEHAVEFMGDDEAYLRWLSQNPEGYVVNTARAMNPNYMVLHRATCPQISKLEAELRGGFTERGYVKICSAHVEPLREWVRRHGRDDGSFSRECNSCRPLPGPAAAGSVEQLQLDYWTSLRDLLREKNSAVSLKEPRAQYSITSPIGHPQAELVAAANTKEGRIAVGVWIHGRKDIFRLLQDDRDGIEREIAWHDQHNRQDFLWLENEGEVKSDIWLRWHDVNIRERARWPEFLEWHLKNLEAFYNVFEPRLRELGSSNNTSKVARIDEPVMAISIGGQYPNAKNDRDLYHAIRGAWRIDRQRAEMAEYAFAVYKGVIKEVYKIDEWRPASPELYGILERLAGRQNDDSPVEGDDTRSEFVGGLAPEDIREKYVGRRIPKRSYGAPILYFNC